MARFWHNGGMLHRQSHHRWKICLAAGSGVLLHACAPGGPDNAAVDANVQNAPVSRPIVLPAPEPPLDRQKLLVAAMRAASAAALGRDDREEQGEINDRRFEFRMPFGCAGGARQFGSWTYDQEAGALRIEVTPDLPPEHPVGRALIERGAEELWGFTVSNPWLLIAGCPGGAGTAQAESWPSVTIAQVFTEQDSRVQRPEQEYRVVKQVAPEDAPRRGLNLVLAGRLEPLDDGRSIRCAAAEGPPSCLISVQIDRVEIENPQTGATLGEWGRH